MTRDTVGKISSDLIVKSVDNTHSAEEQMREQLIDYDRNILECINIHKNIFFGSFFVVVTTKKERLMQNVIRNYFFARQSCPSPEWDQTVYKYDPSKEEIEFLWVIPSKDTCEYMIKNALEIDPSEHELRRFVLEFSDGSLLRQAKKLNGEKHDSLLLE